jgi:hypothetical protein
LIRRFCSYYSTALELMFGVYWRWFRREVIRAFHIKLKHGTLVSSQLHTSICIAWYGYMLCTLISRIHPAYREETERKHLVGTLWLIGRRRLESKCRELSAGVSVFGLPRSCWIDRKIWLVGLGPWTLYYVWSRKDLATSERLNQIRRLCPVANGPALPRAVQNYLPAKPSSANISRMIR